MAGMYSNSAVTQSADVSAASGFAGYSAHPEPDLPLICTAAFIALTGLSTHGPGCSVRVAMSAPPPIENCTLVAVLCIVLGG